MIAVEGNMKEIAINEKISYIACSENPLSADIGIIQEGDALWLYDVPLFWVTFPIPNVRTLFLMIEKLPLT